MRNFIGLITFSVLVASNGFLDPLQPYYNYAIVVSEATHGDPAWREVVDSLCIRHNGKVFVYPNTVWDVKDSVAAYNPDYIAFVCQIPEASPTFVQYHAWPFSRQLDADPYGDAAWGIITGCDAADALKLVTGPREIEVKTVLGGTSSCYANYYPQGIATYEGTYGRYNLKYPDSIKNVQFNDGPTDRTEWLVDMINGDSLIFEDSVDIFYTSGHGSPTNWQLHYPTSGLEGYFRSDGTGHLYGDPYSGPNIDILSDNPKIYFALGNCLVGQVNGPNCMVPAWIRSGGAKLVTGYVVYEGAYSYQHGATKAYFSLQDHCPWPIAFFLGNIVFKFDLDNNTPGIGSPPDYNGSGLYGDPALDARIPEGPGFVYDTLLYTKELEVKPGVTKDTITFRITMNKDGRPGYDGKWGHRSPIVLFPFRCKDIEIIDHNCIKVLVQDNFALMYIWYQGQPELPQGTERHVTFLANRWYPGVEEEIAAKPTPLSLNCYPNPFSSRVKIVLSPSRSDEVDLKIYDNVGRLVKTIYQGPIKAEETSFSWSGTDDNSRKLPSGVYFLRLTGTKQSIVRKLLVMR